jgi:hypothetical protein
MNAAIARVEGTGSVCGRLSSSSDVCPDLAMFVDLVGIKPEGKYCDVDENIYISR